MRAEVFEMEQYNMDREKEREYGWIVSGTCRIGA